MGIFGLQVETAVTEVETYASGSDVVRQIELVFWIVGQNGLVFLIFADESASDGDACLAFGERFDDAVEVQLGIDATHKSVTPLPVVALFTEDPFDRKAVYRTHCHFESENGIVHTKIAVFVGTQYHAVAELLIECPRGDRQPAAVV